MRPLAAKIATPVPKIRTGKCIGCGKCAESCPQHTIEIKHKKAYIIYDNCIRCYCCHEMCPEHIIDIKRLALFNL
ncbi:MAG: 4Fe-4S binding protein [Acutalibacteraceae bacterium]